MRLFRRRRGPSSEARKAVQESGEALDRNQQKAEAAKEVREETERHLAENGFSRMLADAYRPRPRRPHPGGAR